MDAVGYVSYAKFKHRRDLEGYSRKTALGASSPAKPALHIPDLEAISHAPHSLHPPRGGMSSRIEDEKVRVHVSGWGKASSLGVVHTHCR